LVNLIYRGLFARDQNGIKLPLKSLATALGNTDRIEKTIDVPPEMISSVETGDAEIIPDLQSINPPSGITTEEVTGETGDEAGDVAPSGKSTLSPNITPTPTITPEVDEEGIVIPKAIPVIEP